MKHQLMVPLHICLKKPQKLPQLPTSTVLQYLDMPEKGSKVCLNPDGLLG